jgi:hypothetical protein
LATVLDAESAVLRAAFCAFIWACKTCTERCMEICACCAMAAVCAAWDVVVVAVVEVWEVDVAGVPGAAEMPLLVKLPACAVAPIVSSDKTAPANSRLSLRLRLV